MTIPPLRPIILGILCLALACAPACAKQAGNLATFQFVNGEVYVTGSDGLRRPARPGEGIGPNDVIETSSDSAAEVEVRGVGIIRVGEKSRLRVGDLLKANHIEIRVESGRAGFLIKKLNNQADVSVTTPTIVAGVRGTKFLAGVDADGKSKIAMFDGAVELGDGQSKPVVLDRPGEVRVKKGQKLSDVRVEALSAESIAEMQALEAMVSGPARPTGSLPEASVDEMAPDQREIPVPAPRAQ